MPECLAIGNHLGNNLRVRGLALDTTFLSSDQMRLITHYSLTIKSSVHAVFLEDIETGTSRENKRQKSWRKLTEE